jgi:hypothetical protein
MQALALTPLVFLQKHGAKRCQRVRPRIIERTKEEFAILDGQRDEAILESDRLLE